MARILLIGPDDGATAAVAARLAPLGEVRRRRAGELSGGIEAPAAVYRPSPVPGSMEPDLAEADAVLGALAGVPRLVLLSSSAIQVPSHHNPGYHPEPYKCRGDNPIAAAWRTLEERAAARLAGADLLALRPAPVLAPGAADFWNRLLSRRVATVPAGYDPALQLLAPGDLAEAVAAAVERGAGRGGAWNVAPAGAVPVRGMLRLAGVRRIALPLGWHGPSARFEYLRHPWTVSGGKIAEGLGFEPRRTSAEAVAAAFGKAGAGPAPAFDDFGLDEGYIAAFSRTLFRFLHDVYWRVELDGMERIPREGRAVLTGVHRGFMPWDGVMALHAIRRETGRIPRFLIHPCLVKMPHLASYMTKLGGILACQENADRVLRREGLLGMFPEGIQGAFTPYRDAYRLGRFGRDEYVKMALRNRAPLVPFVTVGSAEIYPILGRIDSRLVRRVLEWPYLPVTPTFPLPGLPLPSKWHTRFLEPLHVERRYPPEAAEDPAAVREISAEVRGRMEEALGKMLSRRRSIFFGSVFGDEEPVSERRSAA
jgi:1-acyl-sn-glycerol-3-phosphate acyltransferase